MNLGAFHAAMQNYLMNLERTAVKLILMAHKRDLRGGVILSSADFIIITFTANNSYSLLSICYAPRAVLTGSGHPTSTWQGRTRA